MEASISINQINIKEFKKISRINRGGCGVVYKVKNKKTGKIYAAKVIYCDDNKEQYKKISNREIEITKLVDHPTIIKTIAYSLKDFQNENNVTLIMQLAENGSLSDVLKKIQFNDGPSEYSNTTRQIILIGAARGMKYLHGHNIIHRDLKPGNVVLDNNFHPLITDFGLSKYYKIDHSKSQSNTYGTLPYMAPEVIKNCPYNTKADVYSFGILMYEVLTDLQPYPDLENGNLNSYDFQSKVVNENYRPKFLFPIQKSLQTLIEQCLSNDPDDRPTFTEIFNKLCNKDYFLDDVDEDEINLYIDDITQINDPIEELNIKFEEIKMQNQKLKKIVQQETNKIHKLNETIQQLKDHNQQCINIIQKNNKIIKNFKKAYQKQKETILQLKSQIQKNECKNESTKNSELENNFKNKNINEEKNKSGQMQTECCNHEECIPPSMKCNKCKCADDELLQMCPICKKFYCNNCICDHEE